MILRLLASSPSADPMSYTFIRFLLLLCAASRVGLATPPNFNSGINVPKEVISFPCALGFFKTSNGRCVHIETSHKPRRIQPRLPFWLAADGDDGSIKQPSKPPDVEITATDPAAAVTTPRTRQAAATETPTTMMMPASDVIPTRTSGTTSPGTLSPTTLKATEPYDGCEEDTEDGLTVDMLQRGPAERTSSNLCLVLVVVGWPVFIS